MIKCFPYQVLKYAANGIVGCYFLHFPVQYTQEIDVAVQNLLHIVEDNRGKLRLKDGNAWRICVFQWFKVKLQQNV